MFSSQVLVLLQEIKTIISPLFIIFLRFCNQWVFFLLGLFVWLEYYFKLLNLLIFLLQLGNDWRYNWGSRKFRYMFTTWFLCRWIIVRRPIVKLLCVKQLSIIYHMAIFWDRRVFMKNPNQEEWNWKVGYIQSQIFEETTKELDLDYYFSFSA